ncbi:MAG: glycosyltransferase family 9 protein [Candidatus Brocadiia bacterium]
MKRELENILVMKLGGIGDVITAVPALRSLRKTYPGGYVALAAERPGIEVLEEGPLVDEYLECTKLYRCQDPFSLMSGRIVRQAIDLYRSVRSRRWDAFVCLQSLWRRSHGKY